MPLEVSCVLFCFVRWQRTGLEILWGEIAFSKRLYVVFYNVPSDWKLKYDLSKNMKPHVCLFDQIIDISETYNKYNIQVHNLNWDHPVPLYSLHLLLPTKIIPPLPSKKKCFFKSQSLALSLCGFDQSFQTFHHSRISLIKVLSYQTCQQKRKCVEKKKNDSNFSDSRTDSFLKFRCVCFFSKLEVGEVCFPYHPWVERYI